MKHIILIVLIISSMSVLKAQSPLIDKKGTAHFYSEAPLENIEATNQNVVGAVDLNKGILAVTMFIKDFHFDKSLMEEHFNENYLESDKYPKATFKGVIKDFSTLDLSKPGTYNAQALGKIEIHGVTKALQSMVEFIVTEESLSATTSFDIEIAEFDIKIPKLVLKNIAEVVEVNAAFNFKTTK